MKSAFSRVMLMILLLAACVMLTACGSAPAGNDNVTAADAPAILPTVNTGAQTANAGETVSMDLFPTINANGVSVPAQIRAGDQLSLSGTVSVSRGSISQIAVTVLDQQDATVATGALCPGGASYTFDTTFTDIISFRSLRAGEYKLVITVCAQDGIYANDEIILSTPVKLY